MPDSRMRLLPIWTESASRIFGTPETSAAYASDGASKTTSAAANLDMQRAINGIGANNDWDCGPDWAERKAAMSQTRFQFRSISPAFRLSPSSQLFPSSRRKPGPIIPGRGCCEGRRPACLFPRFRGMGPGVRQDDGGGYDLRPT